MKHWRTGIWIVAIVVTFIGCGKGDDKFIPDTSSGIKILNAVPGTEAYDAVLNEKALAVNLKSGEQSAYVYFRAKKYIATVYPTGNSSQLIIRGEVSLRNQHLTTIFVGRDFKAVPAAVVIDDDITSPTKEGNARVRFISMSNIVISPGQPMSVDVVVDATIVQRNLGFTAVAIMDIPEGDHTLDLYRANDATKTSLLKTGKIPFSVKAGERHTVWFNGDNSTSDLKIFTYQTGK